MKMNEYLQAKRVPRPLISKFLNHLYCREMMLRLSSTYSYNAVHIRLNTDNAVKNSLFIYKIQALQCVLPSFIFRQEFRQFFIELCL